MAALQTWQEASPPEAGKLLPNHNEMIVITVYEPDPALWEAGFTRRKQ